MENGRNNDDGISGRQLRELLRSLPAAHAPEDLELNLLYRIAENESYPHRSRPRIPRARLRAAASESARRTRGYDRIRGLAAAALAAFMLAGAWMLYTEPAPEFPAERPVARPLEMMPRVEKLGVEPADNGAVGKKHSAPVVEKEASAAASVTTREENHTSVTTGSVAPSQATTVPERTYERETPVAPRELGSSPLDPAPTSIHASPSGTHTTSGAQSSSADTTTLTPAPPEGNPDVGTGGEPAEDPENQSH
jgi:hypothetical protein